MDQDLVTLKQSLKMLATGADTATISALRTEFLGTGGVMDKLTSAIPRLPSSQRKARLVALDVFNTDITAILSV